MTAGRLRAAAAALVALLVLGLGWMPALADTSGTVHLQTVPALAGVRLAVGTHVVTTGPDGSASVKVASLNGIAKSVTLANSQVTQSTQVRLSRVAILPHAAQHVSNLQVGLVVTSTVQLGIDSGQTGVPISSIRSIRLHSASGEVRTIDPRRSPRIALLARQPRLIHNTLTAQTVTWSVDSIGAAPGVAVTSAQPRFDPFGAATWNLQLRPVAGTVHIQTVPATAGVSFVLDDVVATTDRDGTATAAVDDLSDVYSRLKLADRAAGDLRVDLLKATRARSTARRERNIVAALAVDRPVRLHFVDGNGHQVPIDQVSTVWLQADGRIVRRSGTDLSAPIMLRSAEAKLARNRWQVHRLTYAIRSATINGSEAAFTGQQHFQPVSAGVWRIRLAVFQVTVVAHDALFGERVTSHVTVTRPDGSQYSRQLAASGAPATLDSVVRGDYRLRFSAAIVGSTTPVHISRNDSFDIRVVTSIDAAAVGGVVALLAAAAIYGAIRVARREAGGD